LKRITRRNRPVTDIMMMMMMMVIIIIINPWDRVLLEKLTDSQLVNKFPTFYGTRKYITAFASARHLSLLSLARSIKYMPPHSTS
jgi:hypothetical protein